MFSYRERSHWIINAFTQFRPAEILVLNFKTNSKLFFYKLNVTCINWTSFTCINIYDFKVRYCLSALVLLSDWAKCNFLALCSSLTQLRSRFKVHGETKRGVSPEHAVLLLYTIECTCREPKVHVNVSCWIVNGLCMSEKNIDNVTFLFRSSTRQILYQSHTSVWGFIA